MPTSTTWTRGGETGAGAAARRAVIHAIVGTGRPPSSRPHRRRQRYHRGEDCRKGCVVVRSVGVCAGPALSLLRLAGLAGVLFLLECGDLRRFGIFFDVGKPGLRGP